MATSFVNYKEDKVGFWIKDSILQLVLYYLSLTIESSFSSEKWLGKLKENFEEHYLGNSPGFIDLQLINFIDSEEKRLKFIQLINFTKKMLEEKGQFISVHELNTFESMKDTELRALWTDSFEVKRLIKVLDNLVLLLDENLKFRIDDKKPHNW